jgi:hypothetical protein
MDAFSPGRVVRVLAAVAIALGTGTATSTAATFDEAELFFELNNTDGDLGIHAKIDGDDWRRLTIVPPNRRRELLEVSMRGSLRKQGLTELAFESAEPTFAELPPAEFLARFPAGDYRIRGVTLDGETLESTATITHVMPAPPVFNQPPLASCDTPVVVTAPLTASWQPVTMSHPGVGVAGQVVVERYEVAIERNDLGLVLFVELPPGTTSFAVPAPFTVPGVGKVEVLVKAVGGNRTAEETCFEIKP